MCMFSLATVILVLYVQQGQGRQASTKIWCQHVLADVCVLRTSYEHHTDREDLFGIGVGRHVAEAHAGQAAEGEVEWSDVDAPDGGSAAGPINASYGVVRRLQALPQLMEPPWISVARVETLMDKKELVVNSHSMLFPKLVTPAVSSRGKSNYHETHLFWAVSTAVIKRIKEIIKRIFTLFEYWHIPSSDSPKELDVIDTNSSCDCTGSVVYVSTKCSIHLKLCGEACRRRQRRQHRALETAGNSGPLSMPQPEQWM